MLILMCRRRFPALPFPCPPNSVVSRLPQISIPPCQITLTPHLRRPLQGQFARNLLGLLTPRHRGGDAPQKDKSHQPGRGSTRPFLARRLNRPDCRQVVTDTLPSALFL